MGEEDQVNGVVTEENGAAETEAAPEQTQAVPETSEAAESGQAELEAVSEPEKTQAVPETSEAPENGQAEAAPEQKSVAKPEEENKNIKTVANILHRVKEDTEMSSDQKIDTLSMLLTKFVAENGV